MGPEDLSSGPTLLADRLSSVVDICCQWRPEILAPVGAQSAAASLISDQAHCHCPQPALACRIFARLNCSCGLASDGLPLPPTTIYTAKLHGRVRSPLAEEAVKRMRHHLA